jgi:hypothetical protein
VKYKKLIIESQTLNQNPNNNPTNQKPKEKRKQLALIAEF